MFKIGYLVLEMTSYKTFHNVNVLCIVVGLIVLDNVMMDSHISGIVASFLWLSSGGEG